MNFLGKGEGKGYGKNWFQHQNFINSQGSSPYGAGPQANTASTGGTANGSNQQVPQTCTLICTDCGKETETDHPTLVNLTTSTTRRWCSECGCPTLHALARDTSHVVLPDPVAQASAVRANNATGGIVGATTAVPMAAMDQTTFNDMLSRNEQFTRMQDDVTALRSSVTTLDQNVQRQFQSIQASQANGFSEMRALLSRAAGGTVETGVDGTVVAWSFYATGRTCTVHARIPESSASAGADSGHGGALLEHSSVPNGAPPVLPSASLIDGVILDSKGDITAVQHDEIVAILGIRDGSAQASKARPNGSCAVTEWWSEFQKAKGLVGWQSLLKDMGVAAAAADGVGCLTEVLPILIDALDSSKACKKPRRSP